MLDTRMRALTAPALNAAGARLARAGIPPVGITAAGWLAGVGACLAAGLRAWPAALGLWLVNRLLDGLDGPTARARGTTELGGFLDIVADFSIYGGIVAGVAVGVPAARLACVFLLASYYISGAALLALSSLAERQRLALGDERSIRFAGGLAEGTETIGAYVAFFLLPQYAEQIAWIFAAMVAITAVQRVGAGARLLRRTAHPRPLPLTPARKSQEEPWPAR
ncbi:MAG TPA: CDP-alcohol phosphatidyltransferase family protein [Streptosporangiaceae bacterium]